MYYLVNNNLFINCNKYGYFPLMFYKPKAALKFKIINLNYFK